HRPDYRDNDADELLELPPELKRKFEEQHKRPHPKSKRHELIYDSQGSGVVIRDDGYILTNSHVVDGAERILIKLNDGTEYENAEIKGVDSQSDVAVLKISAKNLPVVRMGDSSKSRVGEFAVAIGAPFELDYSVTFGHISAKGRRIFSDQVMM